MSRFHRLFNSRRKKFLFIGSIPFILLGILYVAVIVGATVESQKPKSLPPLAKPTLSDASSQPSPVATDAPTQQPSTPTKKSSSSATTVTPPVISSLPLPIYPSVPNSSSQPTVNTCDDATKAQIDAIHANARQKEADRDQLAIDQIMAIHWSSTVQEQIVLAEEQSRYGAALKQIEAQYNDVIQQSHCPY